MLSDMKKILATLLIITAFNIDVNARGHINSRFVFGVEWGYVATIFSGYHYNFFAPEGYRVDDYDSSFGYYSNADMYIFAGHEIGKSWELSAYVGYAGIGDYHEAIPVSIRATHFFGDDQLADRWFAFIDAGSGISLKMPVQEIFTGKIGGGYRVALSRDTSLNFIISARMTYTHPQITYDKQQIESERINRNNAYLAAISFGLSLSF